MADVSPALALQQIRPSAASQPAPQKPLPPLREEISLLPGPSLRGGAPSWTLYDPATNRYFRISWVEFEMLSRWHLGKPGDIIQRVNAETTLTIGAAEMDRIVQFLDQSELIRRPGPDGASQFAARAQGRRQKLLTWLTHNYLFIRIPLLRPDAALQRMLPWLGWAYSRGFLFATIAAALSGLFLVQRQWDAFLASLPWFFSLQGAAVAALALFFAKALHELGHGLTAKCYGCQVPTMGVAILLLVPMLYTDTSAAWRLTQRRQRLAIGVGGMAAELALAAYALLAWSFLPDGMLRSVVFVWATTTWILTLLVNISPFMRFDGYYLLSDALDVPNLQERAFALTRHWLREELFDFGEAVPEHWSPRMRRVLIAYAIGTWLYRLVLFLGIALLVYHMFFKALGVILFAVEIWYFLARPIVNELKHWPTRLRASGLSRRAKLTMSLVAIAAILFVLPWRTTIQAPAVMASENQAPLYLVAPARVEAVRVRVGDSVTKDQVLVSFDSPDLQHRLSQALRAAQSLQEQFRAASLGQSDQARAHVLGQQVTQAQAEVAALKTELGRLTIRAPVAGTVVELASPMSPGEWFKAGEAVGLIADGDVTRINAYVDEADLNRLLFDRPAVFIPDDLGARSMDATIVNVEGMAIRVLADEELASVRGGMIASRENSQRQIVPELPVYRVQLSVTDTVAPARRVTGVVQMTGKSVSLAGQMWRRSLAVLLRESGI